MEVKSTKKKIIGNITAENWQEFEKKAAEMLKDEQIQSYGRQIKGKIFAIFLKSSKK